MVLNMSIDFGVQELIVLIDSYSLIHKLKANGKIQTSNFFHTDNVWNILAKGPCTSSLDTSQYFIMNWQMTLLLLPQCFHILETLTSLPWRFKFGTNIAIVIHLKQNQMVSRDTQTSRYFKRQEDARNMPMEAKKELINVWIMVYFKEGSFI